MILLVQKSIISQKLSKWKKQVLPKELRPKELKETLASFITKPDELIKMKDKSSEFVKKRRGATQVVFEELKPYLK